MRVALVIGATTGGIGAHVCTLVTALGERGHEVVVVGPSAAESVFRFTAAGARFAAAPVGATSPLALARSRASLRAMHADVVHAHGLRATLTAAAAGVRPLVSSWHNAPLGGPVGRAAHGALERAAVRRADVTLCASPDLAERARRAGGRDVRFAPVAAPTPRPAHADQRLLREDLGLADAPVVLVVARLHHQKRIDLLVEATRGWADRPNAPVVLVAGDGPLRARLAAAASSARSAVRLLGRRDDVPDLLALASVLALPSDWEARPLVVQEAMLAGVPVVATATGGIPDLVGGAALLVPPDDARRLRQTLEQVLDDPALRQRLAAAGRRRAAAWPTVPDMVDEIERVYLDLRSRSG